MNLSNVLELFSSLVKDKFDLDTFVSTTITEDEHSAAYKLFQTFHDIAYTSEIQDNDGLVYGEDSDSEMDVENSENSDDSEDSEDSDNAMGDRFTLDQMKYYVGEKDKHPTWSFETFTKRHKVIKYRHMIGRFRKIIENGGTKKQKFKKLNKSVLKKFNYAREHLYNVHDKDLKRWAIRKAKCLKLPFNASDTWVKTFKKTSKISSRKAKIVSNKSVIEQSQILKNAEEFRNTIRTESWKWPIVINTDQMGFNKELHSTRTLSHTNEKDTFLAVKSLNNCTHSYTVQPSITLDGNLLDNFLLCLYEPTGKIGPNVKPFNPPNVKLTCSSSGKLSRGHVNYWIKECLKPHVDNQEFLIILDSWTTHTNKDIYDQTFGSLYHMIVVPPKTTSIAQPLDVFFNYWWKSIARRIADRVMLDEIDINMGLRDNIIKEQSLIHNQLSSKKFQKMIKYSFFKSGLTDDDPGEFENVHEVCFSGLENDCDIMDCKSDSFIRCSHCEKYLCFDHFFIQFHTHF